MTSENVCHTTVDEFILCTCSNHTINDSLCSVQNTIPVLKVPEGNTLPAICSRNNSTVHMMTSSNLQCTCTKNISKNGRKDCIYIYI